MPDINNPNNPFFSFLNNNPDIPAPDPHRQPAQDDEGFEDEEDERLADSMNDLFSQGQVTGTTPSEPEALDPLSLNGPEMAALDAAAIFMDRNLTPDEARRIILAIRSGSGGVELTSRTNPALEAGMPDEIEVARPHRAQSEQEQMAEMRQRIPYTSDIDRIFGEFMDGLPDPNTTNIWESKFDDASLQVRGLVLIECFQNFIGRRFPEWTPNADDFENMDDYRRAKAAADGKVKYMLGFVVSLAILADQHVHTQVQRGGQ